MTGQATRATILEHRAIAVRRTTASSAPPSARSRRRPASIRRSSCTTSAARQDLFAAASRFDITFPDLSDVAPDRIADVLLPMFVAVWGPQGPFLPLLRAAATNRAAADALLEVFVDQVAPALAAVAPDRAAERAALVGSQLLGTRRGPLHPRGAAAGRHGRRAAHRMAAAGARALPDRPGALIRTGPRVGGMPLSGEYAPSPSD